MKIFNILITIMSIVVVTTRLDENFVRYEYHNCKGILIEARYELDGKLHRENGPAIETFYPDGSLKTSVWYKDGEIHRADGPAYVNMHDGGDGKIAGEEWYRAGDRFGKLHREDGPAIETFYPDGSLRTSVWYKDGHRHREDGPAYICMHDGGEGKIAGEEWYSNGDRFRAVIYARNGRVIGVF